MCECLLPSAVALTNRLHAMRGRRSYLQESILLSLGKIILYHVSAIPPSIIVLTN